MIDAGLQTDQVPAKLRGEEAQGDLLTSPGGGSVAGGAWNRTPYALRSSGGQQALFPRLAKLRKLTSLIPVSRRLLLIIWPFLIIVFILVWLFVESMGILAATRAYSEGESLWSKAQKTAVFHLLRYAETQSELDYQRYLEEISVPLGDEQARVELQKPDPDYHLVREGMLRARNAPEDIPGAIQLFRRFQHFGPMAEVIATWEEGDRHITMLTVAARTLHQQVASGAASPAA